MSKFVLATRDEGAETVGRYGAKFYAIYEYAVGLWRALLTECPGTSEYCDSTRAWIIHDHAISEVRRQFQEEIANGTAVVRHEKGESFVLQLDGKFNVEFLKLNSESRPSRNDTNRAKAIMRQLLLFEEDEQLGENATWVNLGYKLDPSKLELGEVSLGCFQLTREVWSVQVPQSMALENVRPINTGGRSALPVQPKIRTAGNQQTKNDASTA